MSQQLSSVDFLAEELPLVNGKVAARYMAAGTKRLVWQKTAARMEGP